MDISRDFIVIVYRMKTWSMSTAMSDQREGSNLFNIFSFLLMNISRKIKPGSLKKVSDYIFIVVEKIIVKFPSFLPAYIRYYDDIVEQEISLAKITPKDMILHIGCGSLPSTSLLITKKKGVRVTGIDKDLSSVRDAQHCAQVMHLEHLLQILHSNALDYPMDSSSVIIVSQGIEPRYEVLSRIACSIPAGTRVLFRTFSSSTGGLTAQDEILSTLFTIGKTVVHPQHGLLMSILLQKKT